MALRKIAVGAAALVVVSGVLGFDAPAALASAADAPALAPASADAPAKAAESPRKAHGRAHATAEVGRRRAAILAEAMVAHDEILQALDDLRAGKPDLARPLLTDASAKLDAALARDPSMKLAPIAVDAYVRETSLTADQIRRAIAHARDLLGSGDLQAARAELRPLVSEIVFSTGYLPMDTYPGSIKAALRAIQDGHGDMAADVLEEAMGSVLVKKERLALPTLQAEADVLAAEQQLAADPAKNRAGALALVQHADEELAFGELLGYGEAKPVRTEIAAVKGRLGAGSPGPGVLARLKTLLHEATHAWK